MHDCIRHGFTYSAAFSILLLCFEPSARAQYTDGKALEDLGGPQEFAQRRAELIKQTKTGITLLFARNEIPEATCELNRSMQHHLVS